MTRDSAARARRALPLALVAALLPGAAPSAPVCREASWHAAHVGPAAHAATGLALARPRDVVDRPLPGGGRMLASRVPDAGRVLVRLGFVCRAPERELAEYGRALDRALQAALARQLSASGGKVKVEHDDLSVVVAIDAPSETFGELLGVAARALAAPRFEADPAARAAAQAEALAGGSPRSYVDLTGARLRFGPAAATGAGRAASSAAEASFELLLAAEATTPEGSPPAGPKTSEGPATSDGAVAVAVAGAADHAGTDAVVAAWRALHAATVARSALVVAVHGDLDVEAVFQAADQAAAARPATPLAPVGPSGSSLVVPLSREVWVRCDPGRTAAGFAVLGAGCRADAPDAAALLVLEEHLAAEVNALADGSRVAGLAFVPGFGRTGRVAAWVGGEVAGLADAAGALLAALSGAPAITDEALAAARLRAIARAEAREEGLETLLRDHRLALRGAPPGWRARLASDARGVTRPELEEALRRHVVVPELLCAAVTRPERLTDLAALGLVVDVSTREAPADGPAAPADALAERDAARPVVAALFEALGGRATWALAHGAELLATVTRGERALHVTMRLDLAGPRLALDVEDGGVTVLDGARAQWRGSGARRDLDADALRRDAELGVLLVLHQLALEGRLDARLTGDGLLLADGDAPRCLLVLDAARRPVALVSAADPTRRWRLEDWRTFDGRLVPTRIVDEARGVRTDIGACRFTERFDPSALR